MACFLVPAAEAIATSVLQKSVGKEKAKKLRLGWLNRLLWGGVVLLAVEHIWHGEVVPWPPFLTAMKDPVETIVMLKEMAMVGIPMAVFVTIIWVVLLLVTRAMEKAVVREAEAKEELGA